MTGQQINQINIILFVQPQINPRTICLGGFTDRTHVTLSALRPSTGKNKDDLIRLKSKWFLIKDLFLCGIQRIVDVGTVLPPHSEQ